MFNPLIRFAMGYYDDDETYDEYNGTYVQDVEGWSDQMIEDRCICEHTLRRCVINLQLQT